jgi:CheY-like chemotaxis protein
LAGGVVHGFNNVLMAIMGNAFLARKDLPPDAPSRHFFLQIDQATQRGSQLCHSLQLFAGKVHPGTHKLDFNAHIESLLPDLVRTLKRPELCIFTPGKNIPPCVADGGQLEKLLRHVLNNAAEAYGDNPGPIRFLTGLVDFDPTGFSSPAPFGNLQKGQHILLEVSDDGPGVDPSLHSRLFDPFFTTKAGHKGIGLAEVAGVLRGHGGAIRVNSSVGGGFALQFLFPLVQQRPSASTRAPMPVASEKWRGSGQILVVDDEETVREVAASMLESLGFSPLVAKDGMEGLRILRQHADTLKLVLLDYSMPIMDGESTLIEFAKIRPDIPVLFMSGHESRELRTRVNGGQLAGVLGKPFSMELLQTHLRKALGTG